MVGDTLAAVLAGYVTPFVKGDFEALAAFLAPSVEWTGPFEGQACTGPEAVIASLRRGQQAFAALGCEAFEAVEHGHAVLLSVRGPRFDAAEPERLGQAVQVLELDARGRLCRISGYLHRAEALAAIGAPAVAWQ
jgi:hypothetical protein